MEFDLDTGRYVDPEETPTTPVPDVTTPESPKPFLDSVGKGIYVIKTPSVHQDEDRVSKATSSKSTQRNGTSIATSDRTQIYGVDENEQRGNWTGRFDFLLSMLGYSVGLGNIWRFPYLCYRNGGGAFLVPYIIMLVCVGVPLFYLEACLGQFSSCGPLTCWSFCPLFKGIGVAMLMVSGIVSIYYNMVVSWAVWYFFASFTSSLPWSTCDNKWNTKDCSLNLPKTNCTLKEGTRYLNGTCFSTAGKFIGLWNDTRFTNYTGRQRITPSEEYWRIIFVVVLEKLHGDGIISYLTLTLLFITAILASLICFMKAAVWTVDYNYVLGLSSGIDDMGLPRWQASLTLFFSWILCFLCLIKGIKTTGKVVYFTAIFPYVVLLILFFRGVLLPGAADGVYFYIVPTFDKLLDAKVWRDGAVQVFYSLGPGWGGLIALSSYNRFHNNVLRDSIFVALGDGLTSIFGGFVIFSYLGYMAHQLNVGVKDVARSGAGLAFVVYPEAVNNLPPSTLWALLFFFMLITLGLDSQFAMLETVLTGFCDYFPYLRPKKTLVIFITCIFLFLIGLPLTCPGGMYLLQLIDHYSASWSLLLIGLTEVTIIVYVYGINRFYKDLTVMQGYPPSIWWKICWIGICPVGIIFILMFAWIDYSPAKYDDYLYPAWGDALGWIISFSSVIAIPIVMVYKICKESDEKTILGKVKLLLAPSRDWGPALVKHRRLVDYVDGFVDDPEREKNELTYVNYAFDSKSNLGSDSIYTSRDQSVDTEPTYVSRSVSHVSFVSFESNL